jgi:hypothetical protein
MKIVNEIKRNAKDMLSLWNIWRTLKGRINGNLLPERDRRAFSSLLRRALSGMDSSPSSKWLLDNMDVKVIVNRLKENVEVTPLRLEE